MRTIDVQTQFGVCEFWARRVELGAAATLVYGVTLVGKDGCPSKETCIVRLPGIAAGTTPLVLLLQQPDPDDLGAGPQDAVLAAEAGRGVLRPRSATIVIRERGGRWGFVPQRLETGPTAVRVFGLVRRGDIPEQRCLRLPGTLEPAERTAIFCDSETAKKGRRPSSGDPNRSPRRS